MARTEVSGSQIKDSSVALSDAASPTGTSDVTGVLPAANGGTGLAAPGASGNVLTSDGTNWTSAAGGGGGGGGGSARVTSTVTSAVTLGSAAGTQYLTYIGSGGSVTLPTAISNTSSYIIKNIDTTAKTIATAGDDASFASPGEMPAKIRAYCEKTGQPVPLNHGQVLRVASESLALKYRVVYDRVRKLTGRDFTRLHAGGGGIQNELLSQATANALGIEVIAGPVEATSCGNVITQMVGTGHLPDIKTGRDLIRRSFEFRLFAPGDSAAWEAAFLRFKTVLGME